NNPITLLLLSKYFSQAGNSKKVIPTLEKAYESANLPQIRSTLDPHIYESIILSLISFHLVQNNHENVQKYIVELEKLPGLLKKHEAYLSSVKRKLDLQ
ncbi:MAG: hypothetical protein HYZ79_02620, partial [Candidatus Melainabacteria bacterium]|nr:hypothetical protein [Candidatus Melainabacteria bacterium]